MIDPIDWLPGEPPLFSTIETGTADIWRVALTASVEVVDSRAAILSDSERTRAERFHFERDRHRYILCRSALRQLLTRYESRLNPSEWVFKYGKWDKPDIPNYPYAFNVTHCEDWALIGFSPVGAIGVDIERVRPMDDMTDLTETVFSAQERQDWHAFPDHTRPWGFFAGWTRKEGIVKAIGQGLSLPLQSFSVSLDPTESHPSHTAEGWSIRSFSPVDQFLAAVATDRPIHTLNPFDFPSHSNEK